MDRDRYGPSFMRAARHIARIYNKHLAGTSLTASQHVILEAVGQSGPIALQDLADKLVIERSALHRTLQPLRQARFVDSIADATDKRRPLYQLTDEGKQVLESSATHICSAEAEIEELFGASDLSAIRGSLLPAVNALGSVID